jgi:radical SAM protein with 4Fe4S-binding SPASM domain
MLSAIDQAKEIPEMRTVGFSGGEPFLYYDLLKKGMDYAKSKGFNVSVATNGFWGAWEDKLLEERIRNLPVDHISFSYDYYHSEFVGEEAFARALNLCKSLKISHNVGIGETKDKKANDFLLSLGSEKYLMDFYIYPYLRVGRANEIPDEAYYRFYDTEKIKCRDGGYLAIRYDGEVFPCCVQTIFDTPFSLGNIKENSLKDILKSSDKLKLLGVLHNISAFTELKNKAVTELGLTVPEKCTDYCEICGLMFRDNDNFQKLLSLAEPIYDKLLIERFFNRKGAARK